MAVNMNALLEGLVKFNASDLHLKVGGPPMIRLHGVLRPVDHPTLMPEDTESANDQMMPERCREQLLKNGTADFSYGLNVNTRFRVNCYHQRGVKSLAIRKIDSRKVTIDELNLPPQLARFAKIKRGLLLVTGVTGSGKSSTLSALINLINETRREHIITIEDPIEFVYKDEKCIIDQIEVNQDVASFQIALRAAMRQDPDIILLGELRDRETVETAMHCVDTGHVVFSTLHTADAKQTVNRLAHFYAHEEQELIHDQLSKNLKGIICQRLVKTKDGRGRRPVCEIMFEHPVLTKLIRENRTDEIPQVLRSGTDGMQTFDMALVAMVKDETVDLEEAMTIIDDEAAFRRLLKGRSAGGDRGGLIG